MNMKLKLEKLKSKKVLFIEEDENISILIKNILNKLDMKYDFVPNTTEAQYRLEVNSYDIIVTNSFFSESTICNLTSYVRERLSLLIPILILYHSTEEKYNEKVNGLENVFYLPTPFDFIKFINTIDKIY